MPESGKIPVTIITGFLGSGKTTLVNYVLRERGNRSIAVIENEFGEVNIDRELVSENLIAKEDLVSLENGCVCCSLRRDIVRALAELGRRDKYRGKPVEAVLLETTGLADPAPVAFTFFANPWIAARFKLDSIVCVVDARHLLQHLEDVRPEMAVNEAAQQIAFADLILLNKTDLVSSAELQGVIAAIKSINTTASIVHCQLNKPEGRPPLTQLLDTNYFSIARARTVDPTFLDSDSDPEDGPEEEASPDDDSDAEGEAGPSGQGEHLHSLGLTRKLSLSSEPCEDNCQACAEMPTLGRGERFPKRRHKKMHDLSGVGSVGIVAKGPLDEYRFNMFMRDLLAEKSKDIFRCKGVLLVHGHGNTKFVFQGVHETINYGPALTPWSDDDPKINRLVFIGRGLDRKSMLEGFRSCIWVPLPEGWEEFRDPQSKRPFYYNKHTKERSWMRPELACARVTATPVVSTSQPKGLLPKQPSLPAPSSFGSKESMLMA